jgi:DNA-binding CsgD family transcriptional regulator
MEGDWQSYRERALGLLSDSLGARAAAWWSRSVRGGYGTLAQYPEPFIQQTELDRPCLPRGSEAMVQSLSATGQAFVHAPNGSELLHTVVLQYPRRAVHAAEHVLERIGVHLCAAGALSMLQFVRRDDWLHSMGRANRGSAALADADGTLYAVSDRFRGLLEETGHAGELRRLPFALPPAVLGERGGEQMIGGLHLRIGRCGNLHLLHARKPLPLDTLSPREQEIARALSNGKTLKSIARQYGIAVSTVANHTTRIYRKLAIYRREDLIELLHMKPSTVR